MFHFCNKSGSLTMPVCAAIQFDQMLNGMHPAHAVQVDALVGYRSALRSRWTRNVRDSD
jgi:hypothetical protein